MDIISLVLVALQGLSVVVKNPALGGGSSLRFDQVSKIIDTIVELLSRGQEGQADLEALTNMIQQMAAEGRAPTPAEWAELKLRSDTAHEAIQAAAAAAAAEEKPLEDMTKDELIAKAEAVGADFNSSMVKADIVEAILAATGEDDQE